MQIYILLFTCDVFIVRTHEYFEGKVSPYHKNYYPIEKFLSFWLMLLVILQECYGLSHTDIYFAVHIWRVYCCDAWVLCRKNNYYPVKRSFILLAYVVGHLVRVLQAESCRNIFYCSHVECLLLWRMSTLWGKQLLSRWEIFFPF